MYECFHCGARAVIWDGDFNSEDYGYEPGGVIHDLHCEACGAIIQYLIYTENKAEEQGEDLCLSCQIKYDEEDGG